ncbi:unnamed protein product [Camellia sinensis]
MLNFWVRGAGRDSVSSDDELYVWAVRLFLRDKRRECFMTLPTDEV